MLNKFNRKRLVFLLLVVIFLIVIFIFRPNKSVVLVEKLTLPKIIKSHTNIASGENHLIKSIVFSDNKIIRNSTVVRSYVGSNPDGAVNKDENGSIIVDADLKRLFNYFLSATGELNQNQILKQLIVFTDTRLNIMQRQEVLELFDLYRHYLVSLDQMTSSLNTDLSQLDVMNLLSEIRIDLLGKDMALAFFSDEEKYLKFVMSNKNIDNHVFSEQQSAWLNSENITTIYQDTVIDNHQYYHSSSITQEEVQIQRIKKYGEPVAQRLQQLDQQRKQWQITVDDYFAQRQLLGTDTNDVLILNSQYSRQNSQRLQALWRIKNTGS